jgi:hypothetical protein
MREGERKDRLNEVSKTWREDVSKKQMKVWGLSEAGDHKKMSSILADQ